jgi:hypothetical protein
MHSSETVVDQSTSFRMSRSRRGSRGLRHGTTERVTFHNPLQNWDFAQSV